MSHATKCDPQEAQNNTSSENDSNGTLNTVPTLVPSKTTVSTSNFSLEV